MPLALVSIAAMSSCSIKEDRSVCPAYLNVSFADKENIKDKVSLLAYDNSEVFRSNVKMEEADPYWVKVVSRGKFRLAAYYGRDKAMESEHLLSIPLGVECDSLYAFYEDVDCTGDEAYSEVQLHKQFCTVHLDIKKAAEGHNSIQDYSFIVEGNTCGFDLMTFDPVSGDYRIEPVPAKGSNLLDFRVPRQLDNSMTVDVWYIGDHTQGPKFMHTIPLGVYIDRLGYRWDTVELQDIYVLADFVAGYITVSVDGWEDGYTFTFIEQ